MDKIKVGFFSFTCCEGCTISFIEILNEKFDEYNEKIDIKYFRALRPVKPLEAFDIAFVEGAISTPEEIKKLKEIRKFAKKVVALGSGAINGWPSNLRNELKGEQKKKIMAIVKKLNQIEKISPIKEFINVDDEIIGCPVEKKIFTEKIDKYLQEAEKNA